MPGGQRKQFAGEAITDLGVEVLTPGGQRQLFAGEAVTDLGVEVLTPGGQRESVDLGPLLNIHVPVNCETR